MANNAIKVARKYEENYEVFRTSVLKEQNGGKPGNEVLEMRKEPERWGRTL